MNEKLIVAPSPHLRSSSATWKVMLDVIIALIPAVIASCIIFGIRCLAIIAVSVLSAVVSEYLFELITKREKTVGDLSAVVTGLLLALNVPVSANIGNTLWQIAIGSAFAIVIVKMMFGGIGHNFANPAITARIFMLISFGKTMSPWTKAGTDILSGATPLTAETLPSLTDMLLGNYGGSMGETCTLALLIGGIYLIVKKIITWHTPVAYIGTVFVFTWVLSLCGYDINPVYQILAGGLMLGSIFMATDYSTSPRTKWGKVVFGVGAGIITVIIRVFANLPEGVSYAILIMNILTPYIDSFTYKVPFGGEKK
ncbi:MAG: RnfABCDGE type electron transport complex subunit D [Clostridia bacterium]|nr:RnfABCDGE type electron transport complex subunit D [Clostridia bacterium]